MSARMRSRRAGLGAGPDAATASASVVVQNDASSCWQWSHSAQVRLVGAPLVRIERVERVSGGQLVNSGFHDPSCAESSRISRRRASPANILLLMVPSGTPSRSASSDCEKPP